MTPEPRPPEGLVAGKYRLTRLLGKGGMGTVWEGVHESLGTRVAVKFIDAEYATSDDVRTRFVNEAKAAARLRSKHVVQVYDQGLGEDGRPYIVMEFLSGEPLDRKLDRVGRLPADETARLVLHVCRALARAHEARIVHRDLKPENIFIVRDEEDETDIAKVVDFGIAKFTDASAPGASSTGTGAVLGTPQFMSPEQARGLRSVDHRTDLWSMGVIGYRCLVGSLPFRGEAVGDLLVNICTADPPVPSAVEPGVPAGFDAWVRRALARDPADRFQSAAELADALASICNVDARIGSLTSVRGEDQSGPSLASSPGAVTAAPLETTPSSLTQRRRGPHWAVLVALFLAVTGTAAMGARAVLRPAAEPVAPRAVAASPATPDPPAKADPPAVTPLTASPTPPSDSAEPAERHAAPAAAEAPRKHASRPQAAPEPEPAKPASPPPPRPARAADLLGY